MTLLSRPIKKLWRLLPQAFINDAERFLYFRMPTVAAIAFCSLFRRKQREETCREILVIRLDGLGDCVMTLPLLDELRRLYPSTTISIAVQSSWVTLFNGSPSVDRVFPLERCKPIHLPSAAWNLYSCLSFYLRFLKGRSFDIVINPRWDADPYLATMLCALTLAPTTVGYEDQTSPVKIELNRGFQRGYNVVVEAGPLLHEVQRNLGVLRALGYQPRDVSPEIEIPEEEKRRAKEWLGDLSSGFLLVFGLPAAGSHRRWDAQHFIELIRLLSQGEGFIPVMIADQATLSTAEAVRTEFPNVRVAFGFSFPDTAALIEACDIYVGMDSGLAHVAAALKRVTIVLSPHPLGGDPNHHNSPERFRPYGVKSVVIRPPGRRGCEASCVGSGPHCILDIDTQGVAAAIRAARRSRLGCATAMER
jgi:ADP-heptose:LPS heptosyltransferase